MAFVHYRFDETCADEPAAILALVETMFTQIAALPKGTWYIRRAPTIVHERNWGNGSVAKVYCRFSVEPSPIEPEGTLYGFFPTTEV